MERKGFREVDLNNKYVVDKSFQNKITVLENSDELIVHIEPIDSSVTQELKTLITMLSDMSASSQINISSSAKEFLGYEQFYSKILKKLNSLSSEELNYNYALALTNQLKLNGVSVGGGKGIILAKQEAVRQRIAKLEAETKARLAKLEKEKKKQSEEYHRKMIKKNLEQFAKNYGMTNYVYKKRISWQPKQEWDYHSNDHSISGNGTIWFEPTGNNLENGYITGKFQNNKLISNAMLKIKGSLCTQRGFILCKNWATGSFEKSVSSNNLASVISLGISKVSSEISDDAYGGYLAKKSVGQKVCMHGRTGLGFIPSDTTAYVESVSGDRIQLRISDTGGTNPIYHDSTLRQGTIIWDEYTNWEGC